MTHELVVDDPATLTQKSETRATWDLAATAPSEVAASLGLLKEQLVDRIALRPARGDWVVRVGRLQSGEESRCRWYAARRLEVLLADGELERWLGFFLKYFRDGCAEVDHMDVEARDDAGATFDLTLKVAHSAPPVGADEARRRLKGA